MSVLGGKLPLAVRPRHRIRLSQGAPLLEFSIGRASSRLARMGKQTDLDCWYWGSMTKEVRAAFAERRASGH